MTDSEQTNSASSNLDSTVGRMVVEKGFATPEEIQQVLTERAAEESGKSLSQLLIERGVVTSRQLARLKPEVDEQRAGRQIPGYQILGKLGAGAMATVYKARQLSLDRHVAVKVLPLKYSKDENFIRRFYDEGRAAAKLNHPNIVQAFDVGQAGEYHYFVMEFVDGSTVYDFIAKEGAYPEARAIEIAIDVAKALEHAHQAGFIHRDVKPKNIMIAKEGTAKLADMGLARALSDREAAEAEAGKAYGTPYYISPEQIRGERDIDFRADIYSFGATLYHMVTGRVPFDGPNPSAVMHKHLKADLVPPDHLNPKLGQGLSEIIEFACARNRSQRYATTGDLLTDLRAVQKGEPPVVARKAFKIADLSTLDDAKNSAATAELDRSGAGLPILAVVAVLGWLLAGVLLLVLAIGAAS
ncbi:MAG: protein kinase [Planctomycetota bacterium]